MAVLEGCRSLLRRLRQRDHGQGRQYTPRLWSVFISAPLALVVAAGAAVLIYRRLAGSSLVGKATPLDVTKTALTIVGAIGAVLVGVYSYRKQRLEEGAAHRADADQFTGRYNSAADQLGSEKAAVRLAGVYAMARLADDWKDQRQVCVDVLCAYLRMPETGAVDAGEAQVRQTIIRVIATHLQEAPEGTVSWSSLDFDFTQAVFNRHTRFDGATFAGEYTRFDGAMFAGEYTRFDGATFSGKSTGFDGAMFSGGYTRFDGATFSGKSTGFDGATFSGDFTRFEGATFSGDFTSFDGATFSGKSTGFDGATFSGDFTGFDGATFAGGYTGFQRAIFSGKVTRFGGAMFAGRFTRFGGAIFSGEYTGFQGATFAGGYTGFEGATFAGKSTSFDGATFAGKSTSFDGATFAGEPTVSFKGIKLRNQAFITKDGHDFRGWPDVTSSR